MESTHAAAKATAKNVTIVYWIATVLFCLQMSFTAYAQLRLPEVAEAFTRLGFPAYFRVELSWAKLAGVVLLLAPAPARLKEWAYAGFAINLASALIAHLSVGDGPEGWGWAAVTGALWGLSYFFWRARYLVPPAEADLGLPKRSFRLLPERRRRSSSSAAAPRSFAGVDGGGES